MKTKTFVVTALALAALVAVTPVRAAGFKEAVSGKWKIEEDVEQDRCNVSNMNYEAETLWFGVDRNTRINGFFALLNKEPSLSGPLNVIDVHIGYGPERWKVYRQFAAKTNTTSDVSTLHGLNLSETDFLDDLRSAEIVILYSAIDDLVLGSWNAAGFRKARASLKDCVATLSK